jgi:hypothetical protein
MTKDYTEAEIDAVLALKQYVMHQNPPHTETALFGTRCPYCGKSDRIRRLDPPQEPDDEYARLWRQAANAEDNLGVCKFCHNLLRLESGRAAALTDA